MPSACQLNGKILYCVQNNYAGNKKLVHRLIISSASKENKEVTIFQWSQEEKNHNIKMASYVAMKLEFKTRVKFVSVDWVDYRGCLPMIPSLCYARILLLARFSVERKAPRYFFCLLSLNFYGHFSVGECLLHC